MPTYDAEPPSVRTLIDIRNQHRIYVVPLRADVDAELAYHHWTSTHWDLVLGLPGLLAYRQNRPSMEDWKTQRVVCSETWFASGKDESSAFSSVYYRDVIAPDESSFADTPRARHSLVLDDPGNNLDYTFRSISFTSGPMEDPDGDLLPLSRPLFDGAPAAFSSQWSNDSSPSRKAISPPDIKDGILRQDINLRCTPRQTCLKV